MKTEFQIDFLGIGAQKCATTWLAFRLNDHPDLFVPPEKEIHFWDHHLEKGIDRYAEFFEPCRDTEQRKGEFTPSYGHVPIERIRKIFDFAPDLRLIYSIRNPIDRAWSAALMGVRDCGMELEEASDQWFIDHFRSKGSRQRGAYAQAITNWLTVFPPESLLVLHYDQLAKHPLDALKRCCKHLNVDPEKLDALPQEKLKERVFEGPKHALRPQLRPVLTEIYQPEMESLKALLHSLPPDLCWPSSRDYEGDVYSL